MIKILTYIKNRIIPTERKQKAGDVILRSLNSAGGNYSVTIPTVNVPKGKDGYYIREPLALPESMRKAMGYGYETEPELRVVEK